MTVETEKYKHENPETLILGRTKRFVATICKDCGLLLEFEKEEKVNA